MVARLCPWDPDALFRKRPVTRFGLGQVKQHERPPLPAISFPAGFSAASLPIGMQLAGRRLSEELLLLAVHAFQQATNWHEYHPSCQ
jgi:hypothetical protein